MTISGLLSSQRDSKRSPTWPELTAGRIGQRECSNHVRQRMSVGDADASQSRWHHRKTGSVLHPVIVIWFSACFEERTTEKRTFVLTFNVVQPRSAICPQPSTWQDIISFRWAATGVHVNKCDLRAFFFACAQDRALPLEALDIVPRGLRQRLLVFTSSRPSITHVPTHECQPRSGEREDSQCRSTNVNEDRGKNNGTVTEW